MLSRATEGVYDGYAQHISAIIKEDDDMRKIIISFIAMLLALYVLLPLVPIP